MKAQAQLIKHDPDNGCYGDCHRTAIASVLNMMAIDVPHFLDDPSPENDWNARIAAFLRPFGLGMARFLFTGDVSLEVLLETTAANSPGVPMVLGGQSPLGNHSVVIMDGRIVSDPAGRDPGEQIVGPRDDGFWRVEAISVGNNWTPPPAERARHPRFPVLANDHPTGGPNEE